MEALSALRDEELAALVQRNNTDAFGVLVERYQAKLLRYGRRFLARDEHIEDAVQEIFIKTYQNIESYDSDRPFSPWLYRIAHNVFVNTLRQKKRDPLLYIDFDALIAHPSYERDPAGEEERAAMQQLLSDGLEALSPAYREVLVLYYLEELSYQEIADVLQVPIGTVGVRLSRAREALQKYVGRK